MKTENNKLNNKKIIAPNKLNKNISSLALAGVVQWTECQPANQRGAGSFPSQGTCLG